MILQKGYIKGANFTRIMGALGIVIFHFSCYCEPLHPYLFANANTTYGPFWVALFFALSGACVVRSNTETSWWPFYKKRWMGIFPMFFLAYILVFAIKILIWGCWWSAICRWTIPLTLIGMDSYFYYIQPNFCCVGEWFIGAILVCYLLFPLLRKMVQFLPISSAILLLAGCGFIPYFPWFDVEPWRNIWVCATIFYLGMLLAQYPAVFTSKVSLYVSGLLTLIMFIIPLPFKQYAPMEEIFYPIISGLAGCVFLTQVGSYLESYQGMEKMMAYLGKLSYPVFLVQHIVIIAVLAKCPTPDIASSIGILVYDIFLTFLLSDGIITLYSKIQTKKSNP